MGAASAAAGTRLAGVDVGGSAVKFGLLGRDGMGRVEGSVAVEPHESAQEIFARVARALRALGSGFDAVGVGLPGLLDREAGCVRQSPNLPWLVDVPVARVLGEPLGLAPARVQLENDANAAAAGEHWLGAAKGEHNLLLLTLGTGIGGGLVLDGELFAGEGLAGEVGHLCIDPRGPRCGCGSRGCLEQFASASAAHRRALERALPSAAPGDLVRLAALARERPGPERTLLEEIGYDLGRGLAGVLSLLDVRLFLFGGGFSAALDVLEPGIRRALAEWSYGERVNAVRLARATLGPSAGWIGAASLFR